MTALSTTASWWRPEPVDADADGGSRLAFGALLAFTVILVLSPQVWFPVLKSLRIAFLAAIVAMVAHLLERSVHRRSVAPLDWEVGLAFGLVGWAVLTLPLSYWPGGSVNELTEHFVKAVAFFWLIAVLVTSPRRLWAFASVLVACSIPLSVTAIQNFRAGLYVTADTAAVTRIAGYNIGGSGLTSNPNDLALMLNLLLPIAGALVVTARGLLIRAVALLAITLGAAAVVVTFSRAGFLTLVTMLVLALAAMVRRAPLAGAIVLLLCALATPLIPKGYAERLGTITDIESDPTGSAQGRWADLAASAELVARNPVTGVGLGQNILALNQKRGATWRAVHNVYLQYAVDLGIPGLLFFLWLFVAAYASARVWRRWPKDRALRDLAVMGRAVQIALAGFAVAAFFHPIAYQFYFFGVAGLALAVKHAWRNQMDSAPPALAPVQQPS